MSTTSAQSPPRGKERWLKWARAQKHPNYAGIQDLDLQLRRILNAISWDKIRKRVDVIQEPSYYRLLAHLGNAHNKRLRPPSPVDCEAVRIMNGGQFPVIVSSLLRDAGWEPSACTDPLLIITERLLLPSPPSPSPSPPPQEEEKPDLAPSESTQWMEWAKRQKNPAFEDAPEREELEDILIAVRWNVKTPKSYKLQQPFIHLMGRWGPDGERGPDDVPSAVNLEATRIMNNGKLPQELCEWLANAGWDAEKCCNPKLSVVEKKLSSDPPATMQQQESATPKPVDGGQEAVNTPPETPEETPDDDEETPLAIPKVVEEFQRLQMPAPPQPSGISSSYNYDIDLTQCPRLEMLRKATPVPRTEDKQGEMPPPETKAPKRPSADHYQGSDQQLKRQRTSVLPGDPFGVGGSFTSEGRSTYKPFFPPNTSQSRELNFPRQNLSSWEMRMSPFNAPYSRTPAASDRKIPNSSRFRPPTPHPSASKSRTNPPTPSAAPSPDQSVPGTRTPQPTTIPSTPMISQPPPSDQPLPAVFHDMMAKMADMSAAVTAQVQLRDEEHQHRKDRLRRAFLAVDHASREVGRAGNAFDIARRDLDMALEQQNITIAALKALLDADGAEHLHEPEVPPRKLQSCLPQLIGLLSNFGIFMVLHVTHTFILLGYFLIRGGVSFFKYLLRNI